MRIRDRQLFGKQTSEDWIWVLFVIDTEPWLSAGVPISYSASVISNPWPEIGAPESGG